jgi:hypothetical protein
MSSKVFISYRRDDGAAHAGRVYDRLKVDAIVAAAVLILLLQGAPLSAVGGQLPKPSAIGEADGAAKRKANVDAAEAEAERIAEAARDRALSVTPGSGKASRTSWRMATPAPCARRWWWYRLASS